MGTNINSNFIQQYKTSIANGEKNLAQLQKHQQSLSNTSIHDQAKKVQNTNSNAPVNKANMNMSQNEIAKIEARISSQQKEIGSLKKELNEAKVSLDKQKKQDGWAGKTADFVSGAWKSNNRASVVEEKLKVREQQIKNLDLASQGRLVDKETRKPISYEQYYKKHFAGEKNDPKATVEKYNQSQKEGAETVKTIAKTAAGVAIGAATVATGGAAAVVIGATVAAGSSLSVDYSDKITNQNKDDDKLSKAEMANAAFDGAISMVPMGKMAAGLGKSTLSGLGKSTALTFGKTIVGETTQQAVTTGAKTFAKSTLGKGTSFFARTATEELLGSKVSDFADPKKKPYTI